jgi:hypothetical protein
MWWWVGTGRFGLECVLSGGGGRRPPLIIDRKRRRIIADGGGGSRAKMRVGPFRGPPTTHLRRPNPFPFLHTPSHPNDPSMLAPQSTGGLCAWQALFVGVLAPLNRLVVSLNPSSFVPSPLPQRTFTHFQQAFLLRLWGTSPRPAPQSRAAPFAAPRRQPID